MTIIKQIAVQMLLLTLASKVTLAVHNFGPAFTCITSGSLQPAQLSLYKPLPVPAPAAAPLPSPAPRNWVQQPNLRFFGN